MIAAGIVMINTDRCRNELRSLGGPALRWVVGVSSACRQLVVMINAN